MKTKGAKNNHKGFTIVELMIATAVFGFVLLVTSAGVIAIGRLYYKSLTSSRVNEAARIVMEDVSRSLQFAKSGSVSSTLTNPDGTPASTLVRCFGTDRYTYVINQQVTGVAHGLYRDKRPSETSCVPNTAFTGGVEMLGPNMRLLQFDVTSSNPFRINIRVAYGDNDLLNNYPNNATAVTPPNASPPLSAVNCKTGFAGNQFCAVSALETTVTTRVK